MSEPPTLDPAALARLKQLGGLDLARKMLELYLSLAPDRQRAAVQALQAADANGVERAAHTLKSAAGNVGAVRLQRTAGELESLAAAGSVDQTLGERMVQEYEASIEALRHVLEELES
jgi:HPt (histidine-containing phosphotransfer) domain-containing protein